LNDSIYPFSQGHATLPGGYLIALANVTLVDVYFGRKDGIPARRKQAKRQTLQASKGYNRILREPDKGSLAS